MRVELSTTSAPVDSRLVARLRSFAKASSGFSVLVAGAVFVGWAFDSRILTSIAPTYVAMNPVTALIFILAGCSLWLLSTPAGEQQTPLARRRLGQACAGAALLAGLLRLSEILLGWSLGADQILFAEKLAAAPAGWPSRMAPNTALTFVLLGSALMFLDVETRRGRRPAQYLALGAAFIALLALVGYAYGVAFLYGFARFIPMALNTAVLSLGILCARPDRGLMALFVSAGAGGSVARWLLPAAVVVPVLFGWLRWEGERAGLYSTSFGIALFTTAMVLVLSFLVWRNARSVEQVDAQRQQAQAEVTQARDELQVLNRFLEQKVEERTAALRGEIAERQRAEDGLRRAQAEWERTFNCMTDAVSIHDRDYNILRFNAVFGELFPGVVPGQTKCYKVIHRLDAPPDFCPLVRTFASKKSETYEYFDADLGRYLSVRTDPVMDSSGEVSHVVHIISDITQRKRADEEIRLLQSATRAVSEAPDLPSALQVVLEKVCEATRWAMGEAWVPSADGRHLEWGRACYARPPDLERFCRASQKFVFPPGIGLPGRVWSSKQPAWIPDVTQDANFPRAPVAREVGLKAGVGFPVVAGNEIVAVIDFFLTEAREGDERLIGVVSGVASQLGAVIQRKQVEEALRASERRFRQLVESAPDAIVGIDRAGRIVLANALVEKLFGYTREELFGQPVETLLPERFHHAHEGHRAGYLTEPRSRPMGQCGMNLFGRRKDGSEFPVDVSLSPIETEEGLLITAAIRDITERKRAEEEINRLFTLSLDLSCVAGFDGYFKRLNPAWEKTLGFTTAELLDKPYVDFIHPEDRPATRVEADRLAQGTSVISFENRYRCKDGSYRWLEWTAYPIPEEQLIYAAARDVTERKHAEEELKVLNRTLELRTEELTAVNKELEAFTYSVSHDLRAPLRQIDGFSRLLLDEHSRSLSDQARHYFNRVRDGTRQMGQLVDDLLNLARVGRQEVRRQVCGLSSLLEDTRHDLKSELEGRRVEWRIGPLPFVECDPALMKQVFSNLLSNAVKFTRPRERALIEVGTTNQGGETVVFVRDNGVGFSMKYADKLFGVFQRLHRQEDFEGTGVGLATVQRIIHKHGGRAWAEAELDKGATFSFTLGSGENAAPASAAREATRGDQ